MSRIIDGLSRAVAGCRGLSRAVAGCRGLSRAVVRIAALDRDVPVSSGPGTVVDPRGVICTNRHVVEDGDDCLVEVLDDVNEAPVPLFLARLAGYLPDVDFAVPEIDRDLAGDP